MTSEISDDYNSVGFTFYVLTLQVTNLSDYS